MNNNWKIPIYDEDVYKAMQKTGLTYDQCIEQLSNAKHKLFTKYANGDKQTNTELDYETHLRRH